jgi:Concanavalin A-like lectin/glucanases superfamily
MARSFTPASSQYLSVANPIVSAYPFTMACWFYVLDITSIRSLMAIADTAAANDWWRLSCQGTVVGDPLFFQSRAAGSPLNSQTSTAYVANQWQHACAVCASSTSRLVFLDGGGKGTGIGNNTPAGLDSFAVGARMEVAPGDFMNGRIAWATIWDVALSDAEVLQLAQGMHPLLMRQQSMVGCWPLGMGSPDVDVSGGVQNLTLVNAPPIGDNPRLGPGFAFDASLPSAVSGTIGRGLLSSPRLTGRRLVA